MRCIPGLLACTAGALTALSAYAQVDDNGGTATAGGSFGPGCGHLVNPERECPHISSDQSGDMFYDAAITKKFEVNVRPATISLCIPSTTVPGQPRPICDPVTVIPGTTGRLLTIRIRVDNNGALLGSYDATQPDLVVTGSFHDAFGCTPPDFTGVLLTGRILAFGYDDCVGPCSTFPGRCTANFDFVFQITGGVLAPLYAGKNLGVTFTSENSSFNGNDFNLDGQPDRFTSAFNSKFGNKIDIWASTSLLQGACCDNTTGACTLVAAGQTCPNGTTALPGNSCTPNTCPQPRVCCDSTTGACTIALPNTQCAAGSVALAGATACTPTNPCAQPQVCCDTTTGICSIALPGTQCATGSVSFPNATACLPNPCPQPSVCCDVTSGACTIAFPGVQCVPGTRPLPAATSCLPTNPCPPPHVCCDNVGGFCLIVPPGVPCPTGMSELPGFSACVPNNCPQPSACCDTTTGVCLVIPPNTTCPAGSIPAPSASCNPNACPQPKVCCDATTGFCIVVGASAQCPAGTFQTPATSCVTAACPQPRVCCDDTTGLCIIIPANAQCPAGSTQSTATSCVTAGCPQPKVCCDSVTGACTIVPPGSNCPAGTTQSTAATCTPATCPQPSVCCDITTGVCTIALPGTQCATGSRPIPGVFTCTPNNPCPQPSVCCDTTTGACVIALPGVQCAAGSQPLPGATSCSPVNPCQQPKVCCDATTGLCTIVPPGALCPTGTNQSAATSCTPNSCPQPSVCCDSTTGACVIALPSTQCASGSTSLPGATACTPTNPCPQPRVCCDTTTGACTIVPPGASCPSGTTQATATSCTPNNPCPQPSVCCDTTTGACAIALPGTPCASGTTSLPGASSCTPSNPCPQPSVCCNSTTGACVIALPGAQCAAGSTSLPGATSCTPNSCPQPKVCCDTTTGACTIVPPGSNCPSGTTQSTATSCTPNSCPQPSVCCNTTTGACTIALPGTQCASGTTSLPGATACTPGNPCPQPSVCCNSTTGACVIALPGAQCAAGSTSLPGATACTPTNPCPQPSVCCDSTTGACVIALPSTQCASGSTSLPGATACTPTNPCPQPRVCCDTTTGACTIVPPGASCPSGTTQATATSCTPNNPCPQPSVCCDTTTGACTIALPGAQCAAGSTSLPGATSCTPSNPCPQPSVCCNSTTGACMIALPGTQCAAGSTSLPGATACTPTNPCPQPSVCCDSTSGACTIALPGTQCASGSTSLPGATVCTPTNPCPQRGVCCDPATGQCSLPGNFGTPPPSCDPNYYPFASSNPLTNIDFNESDVLRATSPANGSVIDMASGYIKVWYSDEHANALGVRQVTVIAANGTRTTTNYPTSPLGSSPGHVSNPNVGSTITTGDQQGTDMSGRPLYPALFITDLTVNGLSSHAGDWQYGGTAIKPDDVFGTWKYFTRTVDYTRNPPAVSVDADPDPASNANWNLGAGSDAPPSGTPSEAFGTEARWNIANLGLIPGHSYRFYVMVHDGDQNHTGGDAGQACFNAVVPTTTPSCAAGTVPSLGVACNPNPCPPPMLACCDPVTGQCTLVPATGSGPPVQVSVKLTSNALGLGTSTISSPIEFPGKFFTSPMTGTGTILNVQRSGVAGPGTTSDPLLVTITANTHLDIINYPAGFPNPHDFQAGFISLTAESSQLPDGANEGMGVKAFTVGTSGAGLGLRVLSGGLPQVEGSFDVSGGTDGPDYHGNGAPHVDEQGVFTFAPSANVPASSVVVSLAHFDSTDVVDVTINLTNGTTYNFPNLRTTSAGLSSPAPSASLWYITFANLRTWAPTDIVSSFYIRANDPNPASPRGTAEHFLISGFLATSGTSPGCPAGSFQPTPAAATCTPTTCCPSNPISISASAVPVPCACDRNGDGNLDQTDVNDFLNAYVAQSGQSGSGLSADFNHDGTVNVADFYAFFDCFYASNPQLCATVQVGQTACPGGVKPKILQVQYTGQDCSATSTTQSAGKWHCAGSPNNASQVYIVASEKTNATGKIWFSGLVSLGGSFQISASTGGATTLAASTFVTIYDATHTTILESVDFKTDCSQPLLVGDRYGAVRIVGFTPSSGSAPGPAPSPCSRIRIDYSVLAQCLPAGNLTATIQASCMPARSIPSGQLVDLCCPATSGACSFDASDPNLLRVTASQVTVTATVTDAGGHVLGTNTLTIPACH